MQPDLATMEAAIARGLRAVDFAAMIGKHLQENPPQRRVDRVRLQEAARRVLALRKAIEASGIQLPPLRRIENRDEQLQRVVDPRALTIGQVALMGAVHVNTVRRWIAAAGGPIAAKFERALQQGERARFTIEEAEALLQAGGAPPMEEPGA